MGTIFHTHASSMLWTVFLVCMSLFLIYLFVGLVASAPHSLRLELVHKAAEKVSLEITLMRTRHLGKVIDPELNQLMEQFWDKYCPTKIEPAAKDWPTAKNFITEAAADSERLQHLEDALYPDHSPALKLPNPTSKETL